MIIRQPQLSLLFLLVFGCWAVELQNNVGPRLQFRRTEGRARNSSEVTESTTQRLFRKFKRLQEADRWRQQSESKQQSTSFVTPPFRAPIFDRNASKYFIISTTTRTTTSTTVSSTAESSTTSFSATTTSTSIASTISPTVSTSKAAINTEEDNVMTVTPYLTITTPFNEGAVINAKSPEGFLNSNELPLISTESPAETDFVTSTNTPTLITTTVPKRTSNHLYSTLPWLKASDSNVTPEEDSSTTLITTDEIQTESTTPMLNPEDSLMTEIPPSVIGSVIDSTIVTQTAVPENSDLIFESIAPFETDLSAIPVTTTANSLTISGTDSTELSATEVHFELVPKSNNSLLMEHSMDILEGGNYSTPEEIQMEVKWSEKAEGNSMLVKVQVSDNVEAVRLRYLHVNRSSSSIENNLVSPPDQMEDAEIVLVPMNTASHNGQILLRKLEHLGWYIVCGEALHQLEVLERKCLQTHKNETVLLQRLRSDEESTSKSTQAPNPDQQLTLQSLIIIGVVIGLVVLFAILLAFFSFKIFKARRERKKKDEELRLRVEKKAQREKDLAAKGQWAFDAVYADPDQPYEERCIM